MTMSLSAQYDSSLGNKGVCFEGREMEADPFARQGFILNFYCGKRPVDKHDANLVAPRMLLRATSSLQPCVSLSTAEAELTCGTWAARNVVGTSNVLRELYPQCQHFTPYLYGDNSAATSLGMNQSGLRNVRHLCLQRLWIRFATQEGSVALR